MSQPQARQQLQGFVVGVLVAGAIAGGFFLTRQTPPPASPPPPMSVQGPPAMPLAPAVAPAAPSTPREVADSLFNDAMMANEQKDADAVARAVPSALAAYQALGPLDGDALYHVALLHLAVGQLEEASATADALLAQNPQHLLGLGVSLRAALARGDRPQAARLAGRLLSAYDAEATRPLPEYQDHGRILATYRTEAQAVPQPGK